METIRKRTGLGKLTKIITNKYLLTGITFAIWMLFFDRNDLSLQLNRGKELNKLQQSEKVMDDLIADTRRELKLLKTNPATLEKYAREKYMMKKDNEDLFIVTYDSSQIR
ncbi:MAG: septum formation initiator family protein [Panacibacter sp.]